ncbi:outer membrane protein assembly factor BamA [Kordia sp. SMS9]|uniref:translocation and assembly module lipoprotein TamL n=1 Tax=Kordia sp. SMS9 TaxID=2282170 RepID=UPI000E0E02E7|nr:BamA/TamA family outer membrane protein [Kordia sp. SMS9]AXG69903.1 outer membrane protein assembly factor BamA [Kordia sp. SMS9]
MKSFLAKISLFIIIGAFLHSCNSIKYVKDDELLLMENELKVNGEVSNDPDALSQMYQKPNSRLLSFPLRLHIYNLSEEDSDSTYQAWLDRNPKRRDRLYKRLSEKQVRELGNYKTGFNNWLKKTGEAPVIIDKKKTRKTTNRLKVYYQNKGFFNAEANYEIVPDEKERRAGIQYNVNTGNPYFLDSIQVAIKSPDLDSIYNLHKDKSVLKQGKQYNTGDFYDERERLTVLFRNSGIYNFQLSSIKPTVGIDSVRKDSSKGDYKLPVLLRINNLNERKGDSIVQTEYKVHRIKKVNIFTDYTFANSRSKYVDSVQYEDFTIYSNDKLRFRPKAITDAIFIHADDVYRDRDRSLTYKHVSNLRTFKYPNIRYEYANDSLTDLIANIYLQPRKRFSLGFDIDITHSNIQDYGFSFSTSLISRNVFRGAETLEIAARGTLGASRDVADSEDQFFNISEIGVDVRLNFPRFFFPFNTEKIIPKYMLPTTVLSLGTSVQQNIGLDRQTFTGFIRYNWQPSKKNTFNLELFNLQFIRNLNTSNYFNVYTSSYDRLNTVAQSSNYVSNDESLNIAAGQPDQFIEDVVVNNFEVTPSEFSTVLSVAQRQFRLTQDNLIAASKINFLHNSKESIADNTFFQFRTELELAGNFLSAIASVANLEKDSRGNKKLFGVPYTQYVKTEFDYIKHWELSGSKQDVLAFRTFFGIAIPYGNSDNIPFARSYFGGGSNDNRAWAAYQLGPGRSASILDFNEANLKFTSNIEYRFDLFGSFKGALFADAGNIWNVFDDIEDTDRKFNGFESLKDIALGTGFGLRYDFSFFVLRFDIGFKTYDPAYPINNRWFNDYNFGNAVYNIGINYPF